MIVTRPKQGQCLSRSINRLSCIYAILRQTGETFRRPWTRRGTAMRSAKLQSAAGATFVRGKLHPPFQKVESTVNVVLWEGPASNSTPQINKDLRNNVATGVQTLICLVRRPQVALEEQSGRREQAPLRRALRLENVSRLSRGLSGSLPWPSRGHPRGHPRAQPCFHGEICICHH